jgi:TetR/AcrR family transcriptional repressor of bet genes
MTKAIKSIDKNKGRRALPKEVRQLQLIHATINCIAKNGLSGTTMAAITREAGLSQGIANLHFQSKEKLLAATLAHVTSEYNNGQADILARSDFESLSDKLQALLDFQFSTSLVQKNKLAVWYAFWGEAKARPTYQQICSRSDVQAEIAIRNFFQQVIDEGNYTAADAELLAIGYTALLDGLWLDLLVAPRRTNRAKAKQVATHYLASAFNGHIQLGD